MRCFSNNYRVVALDLLGFGRSPRSANGEYSLGEHAAAVIATLRELGIPAPWIIVGHSFGSLLAVHLAATSPELVERLVLTSLPIYSSPIQVRRQLARSRVSPRYIVDGIRAWAQTARGERQSTMVSRRPSQRTSWVSPQERTITQFMTDQSAWRALPGLAAPITVLNGRRDALLRGMDYTWLEQLEHISLQWLPTGHQLPLDQPEAVLAAITA